MPPTRTAKPRPAPAASARDRTPAGQPAGTTRPPHPGETTLRVPLSALRPSPTNPRRTVSDESIRGLAESLATAGMLHDMLVRPVGESAAYLDGQWQGVDYFEIVDGERRFRAAKLGGLKEVRVKVRPMDDAEALLTQLVANDQREDVRPSEQAAAYRRLADAGRSAEQIATDTGRPVSVVRGLLRLGKLPAWALAAVDAGTLPRATAEIVARVPGEESRKKAAACVLLGCTNANDLAQVKADELDDGWDKCEVEPLTQRDAKDLIRNHFTQELKGCPFDRKSLDLLPEAGSCEACPKRAGNDPEAVAEGTRGDVCLDPDCYRAKVAAYRAREIAKAAEKGIEEAEIELAGGTRPPRGWCLLSDPLAHSELNHSPGAVPKKYEDETLKKLLAAPGCIDVPEYVAFTSAGKAVLVARTADVKRAMYSISVLAKPEPRKKKEKAPSINTGSKSAGAATQSAKSDGPTGGEIMDRSALIAADRCRTMLLANAESLESMGQAGGPDTDAVYQALSLTARILAADFFDVDDTRSEVVRKYVPTLPAERNKAKESAAVQKYVALMTPAEVVGFIFAMAAHVPLSSPESNSYKPLAQELYDYADTTLAACDEQARRELTGEPAEDEKPADLAAAAKAAPPAGAPLADVPGFPPAAAKHLATKGCSTVEQLDAKVAELQKQPGRSSANRYAALREYALDEKLVYPAGDALIDADLDRPAGETLAARSQPKKAKKGAKAK